MEIGCVNTIWLLHNVVDRIKYVAPDDEGKTDILDLFIEEDSFFSSFLQYHGQGQTYENVMRYINMVFTGLFSVEAVLKIFGFGFKVYFYMLSSYWYFLRHNDDWFDSHYFSITSKMLGMFSIL